MASDTAKTEKKRKRRHKNLGRARKNRQSRHSTPSYDELFSECGEPGKPVSSG